MIGIGLDVVDVERMRRVLERTPTLRERLFTPAERAYADTAVDPVERLAVRFAAKEAVMKALGVGLGAFDFHDVEVTRDDSGRPGLRLTGRAEALSDRAGVTDWRLTLSHTATVAEAIAVAL